MPEPPATTFRHLHPRFWTLYALLGSAMLLLAGGLGYRQLVESDEYAAAEQRQNYRRILLPGPRGNLYDREGRLLVGNRPVFSAAVYLNELRSAFRDEYFRLVRDENRPGQPRRSRLERNVRARSNVVQRYLNTLSTLLGRELEVDARAIERHFAQNLLLPFPLVTDLSPAEYARLIEQVPVTSPIQILTDSARYYPHGEAACHTLGFVSSSRDFPVDDLPGDALLTFRRAGKVGRSGLEAAFDTHLRGSVGTEIWSVDPGGFQYERVEHEAPRQGNDLHTSLDLDLQLAAEAALGEKTGAVVALDIASGEVLALVSKPGYDLNDLSPFLSHSVDADIRERGAWLNRAIQGLYPPGSTFKLVSALAGLRTGVIDAELEILCPGHYRVGRRTFHCHQRSGHGYEDVVEAIRDSCNVFFYHTALQMGVEPIAEEARRFHLHEATGIELPGETRRMLVPDPDWKAQRYFGEAWFDGDTANTSIGQGFLLVTPLQMASFVASLARGQTQTRPTLLAPHPSAPEVEPRPADTASIDLPIEDLELIHAGMREAGRGGTARLAGSPTLPVAGKTGTAQVRKEGEPTTLAWFVGYAPAAAPRLAVAVLVEGVPALRTDYGGGATAAPIAKSVFSTYFDTQTPARELVGTP